MRFYHFLGYRPDKNGKAKIVSEEAKVIKLIYKLFLQGYGYKTIARKLTALKIKSLGGTNMWRDNTVRSILSNERYKGDALLQKYYTVDFLNKKLKKNEGEVPQYYIENDHDAIVSKEMFESVQHEMKNREHCTSGDIIGNKVVCGYCGSRFGKKVWHSNDKYRKVVYRCNDKFTKTDKFNGKNKCESKILTEEQIKNLFMESLNEVITNKDEIIKNIELTVKYFDTTKLETEYNSLETSLQTEIDKINNKVYEQAAGKDVEIDHSKYEELKAKLDKVGEKINEMNDKKNKLKEYVDELGKTKVGKYRDEYKDEYLGQFLDKMVVYKDKVKIVFKDGREALSKRTDIKKIVYGEDFKILNKDAFDMKQKEPELETLFHCNNRGVTVVEMLDG